MPNSLAIEPAGGSLSVATTSPISLSAADRDLVAAGLALTVRATADGLDGGGEERRWWRLVATEEFDAWVIEWPPGTGVPRHGHGGADASIAVVRGGLAEVRFDGGDQPVETELRPGSVHRVPKSVSHAVHNPFSAPTTSVHVYSPPLRFMDFYEPADGGVRRDEVEDSSALWSVESIIGDAK